MSEYSAACECLTLWVMIAWRKRREEEVHVSLISQQGKLIIKGFGSAVLGQDDLGTVEINPHIINLQKYLVSIESVKKDLQHQQKLSMELGAIETRCRCN